MIKTEHDWLKCTDVEAMLHCLWRMSPQMAWTDRNWPLTTPTNR